MSTSTFYSYTVNRIRHQQRKSYFADPHLAGSPSKVVGKQLNEELRGPFVRE
jgi:hypothetical protein